MNHPLEVKKYHDHEQKSQFCHHIHIVELVSPQFHMISIKSARFKLVCNHHLCSGQDLNLEKTFSGAEST